jgi:hypothetical protein
MTRNRICQLTAFCLALLSFAACAGSYEDDADDTSPPVKPRPSVQGYFFGADADHPALRNKNGPTGSSRDTGMIVMQGDRIEVKPSCLIRERRHALPPAVSREDQNVCTQTADVCVAQVPIFQRQCDDHCNLCIKCSLFGCYPWRCCDTVCQDVHVGDRCVATQPQCVRQENQWKETSVFDGLDSPRTEKDNAPMSSAKLILDGVKLRFSFLDPNGSRKQVDCPLQQFKPDANAEAFSFTLRNADGCASIFVEGAKSSPTLSMVNEMNDPVAYSQGSLVKTWDGRTLAQPQAATYLPAIDFLGTLTVTAPPLN